MTARRAIYEIPEEQGLFATLYYEMAIRHHGEAHGIEPWIEITNPKYVDPKHGPDWLDYYFDRLGGLASPPTGGMHHRIRSRRDLNRVLCGVPYEDYSWRMGDLREARDLFDRYLRVKPELLEEADAFAREHFTEKTLGVHWRATDKHFDEADPISLDEVRDTLQRHGKGHDTFFVATDDAEFPHWVRKAFPDKRVVTLRTPSGLSWSEDVADNFRKGREAMLDCLLLARCDLLVKTPSILSAWSKLFNLDLPVVLVGEPYRQLLRWRVRLPWGKLLRFRRWRARPLPFLGYYPESLLHDPSPEVMARNRVIEIARSTKAAPGRHYY